MVVATDAVGRDGERFYELGAGHRVPFPRPHNDDRSLEFRASALIVAARPSTPSVYGIEQASYVLG